MWDNLANYSKVYKNKVVLFLIQIRCSLMHFPDILGQGLRFEDLDGRTPGKQGTEEIRRWSQHHFEIRVLLRRGNLLLAVMEGEVPHIGHFPSVGADDHPLYRDIRVPDDAVALLEPPGRIEVLGVFMLVLRHLQGNNAVEGKSEEVRIWIRELHEGVPTLVE